MRESDPAYDHFSAVLEAEMDRFRATLPRGVPQATARNDVLNEQVVRMVRLERQAVDAVWASPIAQRLAQRFLREVSGSNLSVAARPYFRERNIVYTKHVVPELRRGAWTAVYGFAANWAFLLWVAAHLDLAPEQRARAACSQLPAVPDALALRDEAVAEAVVSAVVELQRVRDSVVTQNLPLMVDRARFFARVTPRAEMTDLDFVDTCVEGAIMALDKVMVECRPAAHWPASWHPVSGFAYWRGQSAAPVGQPFAYPTFAASGYRVENHHTSEKHRPKAVREESPANVYRTTAIGRMGGRLINSYSNTHLHLGPQDKRLLYHANKHAAAYATPEGHDYQGIADRIRRARVAWLIARTPFEGEDGQPLRLDPRDVDREVERLYARVEREEDPWTALAELLEQRFEDAGRFLESTAGGPDGAAVAAIMRASSVVPTVDDDGEDRQERAVPYAAPESEQPEALLLARERSVVLGRALRKLTLFERKTLVLLGLAEYSCLE